MADTETPHTPTPWTQGFTSRDVAFVNGGHVVVCKCDVGSNTAEADPRANAAFIVRAVNAHESLVAALQDILERSGDPIIENVARAALAHATG